MKQLRYRHLISREKHIPEVDINTPEDNQEHNLVREEGVCNEELRTALFRIVFRAESSFHC
jgi:hypothetical protein